MPQKFKNHDLNPGSSPSESSIARESEKFDASIDEELDALEVNMTQDGDEFRDSDDGSGLIDDELAEERVEDLTEVGPDVEYKGLVSADPGRDDTSATLRRHYANAGRARDEEVPEDNLDEPRDEVITGRDIDEDSAA
jgi:N utilization substance protein A